MTPNRAFNLRTRQHATHRPHLPKRIIAKSPTDCNRVFLQGKPNTNASKKLHSICVCIKYQEMYVFSSWLEAFHHRHPLRRSTPKSSGIGRLHADGPHPFQCSKASFASTRPKVPVTYKDPSCPLCLLCYLTSTIQPITPAVIYGIWGSFWPRSILRLGFFLQQYEIGN